MTLMSVPVAMLAHYSAVMAVMVVLVRWGPPAPAPGQHEVACFFPGFVAALIVALWMGPPLRKTALVAAALAMVLGSVGSGVVFLVETQRLPTLASQGFVQNVFSAFCLYASFQSLTAIGLGARLWWPRGGMADDDSRRA